MSWEACSKQFIVTFSGSEFSKLESGIKNWRRELFQSKLLLYISDFSQLRICRPLHHPSEVAIFA